MSALYDLAGPEKQPEELPVEAIAAPQPEIAYARRSAQVAGDASAIDSGDLIHEVYAPLAVLMAGFLSVIVWASMNYHGQFAIVAMAVTAAISFILLFIKTGILAMVIWYIASQSGGSMGSPLTMVLKIAALLIFLDAAETWIADLMRATGAITPAGRGPVALIGCSLFVSFVIAVLVSRYAYGLEGSAARTFGRVVAIGNWAMNWTVVLVLGALVHALIAGFGRTSAPRPVMTNAVPAGYAPAVIASSDPDHQVAYRISKGSPLVVEGREWKQTTLILSRDKPVSALIDHLYDAGAQKVYIDVVGDGSGGPGPAKAYVELPTDDAQRAACQDVARGFQSQGGITSGMVVTGKYLSVNLK